MRLSRLFQFRNPLFWIFVILNGLSSIITYLLRTYSFSTGVMLILTGFALANFVIGWRIALRLMRE
jgi:hypothetical protein